MWIMFSEYIYIIHPFFSVHIDMLYSVTRYITPLFGLLSSKWQQNQDCSWAQKVVLTVLTTIWGLYEFANFVHHSFCASQLHWCSLIFALRYASDAPVIRYAKIAMKLPEKTVRDVALRCRWMSVSNIDLECTFCISIIMVPSLLLGFSNDLMLCIQSAEKGEW